MGTRERGHAGTQIFNRKKSNWFGNMGMQNAKIKRRNPGAWDTKAVQEHAPTLEDMSFPVLRLIVGRLLKTGYRISQHFHSTYPVTCL